MVPVRSGPGPVVSSSFERGLSYRECVVGGRKGHHTSRELQRSMYSERFTGRGVGWGRTRGQGLVG